MIAIASEQDIPALIQLINSAYRGETAKQGWTTEAHLIEGLRTDERNMLEIFADTNTTFLKYIDQSGNIIGCMRLQQRADKIYLGMLTVAPTLQGNGIGKDLLQAADAHARAHNCRAIFMTVISVRTELVDWYCRHGYQRTGKTIPFTPNARYEQAKQELEFVVMEKAIN